jgi:hypothetical protein
MMDGLDRAHDTFKLGTGNDDTVLHYVSIRRSRCGWGYLEGFTKTALLNNIYIRECDYGIANVQDHTVFQGSVISNRQAGVYMNFAGCGFSRFSFRCEFNGQFTPAGYNVVVGNTYNNYFDLTCDAGGLANVLITDGAQNSYFTGIYRRGGRNTGVINGCNFKFEGNTRRTFISVHNQQFPASDGFGEEGDDEEGGSDDADDDVVDTQDEYGQDEY